jgi:hypothetical protein
MRSGGRICPRQDMSKNKGGKRTDRPECVPGLDTLWKRVQYLVFFGHVKRAGEGWTSQELSTRSKAGWL